MKNFLMGLLFLATHVACAQGVFYANVSAGINKSYSCASIEAHYVVIPTFGFYGALGAEQNSKYSLNYSTQPTIGGGLRLSLSTASNEWRSNFYASIIGKAGFRAFGGNPYKFLSHELALSTQLGYDIKGYYGRFIPYLSLDLVSQANNMVIMGIGMRFLPDEFAGNGGAMECWDL